MGEYVHRMQHNCVGVGCSTWEPDNSPETNQAKTSENYFPNRWQCAKATKTTLFIIKIFCNLLLELCNKLLGQHACVRDSESVLQLTVNVCTESH